MIASVEIRRYRDDDVLQVGGVHAASRHAAYAGLVAPESLARVTPQTQAEAWRRRLTEGPYPWSMLVVVHPDDRRVAGFVLGSGPGPVATLHAIHVLPELHGSGAGQLLHNDIVAEFRAWSCSTAQLWVLEGNARAGVLPTQWLGARRRARHQRHRRRAGAQRAVPATTSMRVFAEAHSQRGHSSR